MAGLKESGLKFAAQTQILNLQSLPGKPHCQCVSVQKISSYVLDEEKKALIILQKLAKNKGIRLKPIDAQSFIRKTA